MTIVGPFDDCGRWGYVFATTTVVAPILGHEKKVAMSPSSTGHGGQYDN